MESLKLKSVFVLLGVFLFSAPLFAQSDPVDPKIQEILEKATDLRSTAETILAEGEEEAAKYRKKADEARMKAAVESGKNPDRTVIIMSKAEDKYDKYMARADEVLADAREHAQEYLVRAEELEQKVKQSR